MIKHYPDFYDDFHCTALACSDSCCIGWQVVIDDFTLSMYENEQSSFGDKIRENIVYDDDGEASFKMKDGRCPFLNSMNLCDIFINLGEDKLCDICQAHPRFVNCYGSLEETGLGLCCEEVCRLVFSRKDHIAFITREDDEQPFEEEPDTELLGRLITERKKLFSLISDDSPDFKTRLKTILSEFLPKNSAGCEAVKKPDTQKLTDFLSQLECMEDKYTTLIETAKQRITAPIIYPAEALKYENILITEIYRYYLESVYDEDCWQSAVPAFTFLFAVIFCMQGREDAELTDVVKCLSKNIEYSQENLDSIREASEDWLAPEYFLSLIA